MRRYVAGAGALVAQDGDLAPPVAWKHRSERYGEKLATPDTSVGDLIGDVDPIKVAQGRTLGDPETIHYGLVPRTNRGIIAVNELPDLAERIQVALLNVLEERDIQVRGYQLRLPLDLLMVAMNANPEDDTNRGRIITPLKDRFGAEVRTHYPLEPIRRAGAGRAGSGRVAPGTTRPTPTQLRSSRHICSRSSRDSRVPCGMRLAGGPAIGCLGTLRHRPGLLKTAAASRGAQGGRIAGESVAVARVCDLPCVIPAAPREGGVRRQRTRAVSSRCSSTCCAAPSPRRSAPGSAAPT